MSANVVENHRPTYLPNLGISLNSDRIDRLRLRSCIEAVEKIATDDEVQERVSTRRHRWNNLLHIAVMTLEVLERQLEDGKRSDVESTWNAALCSLKKLDDWVSQTPVMV